MNDIDIGSEPSRSTRTTRTFARSNYNRSITISKGNIVAGSEPTQRLFSIRRQTIYGCYVVNDFPEKFLCEQRLL